MYLKYNTGKYLGEKINYYNSIINGNVCILLLIFNYTFIVSMYNLM